MTVAANITMMSEPLPERVTVQYVFSLRCWTPKSARMWAVQHGHVVHAVQSNEQVCIVHLHPPAAYRVQTLQRTYLAGHEGISVGSAILRGSLVGR